MLTDLRQGAGLAACFADGATGGTMRGCGWNEPGYGQWMADHPAGVPPPPPSFNHPPSALFSAPSAPTRSVAMCGPIVKW